MNDKKCKCGSNSTILDGKTWTCFQHIAVCKCKKNHTSVDNAWNFNGITVEDMEYQMPTPDVPGYTEDGVWTK